MFWLFVLAGCLVGAILFFVLNSPERTIRRQVRNMADYERIRADELAKMKKPGQ